jgi:cytochrome c-type biogenesis protein CcmH
MLLTRRRFVSALAAAAAGSTVASRVSAAATGRMTGQEGAKQRGSEEAKPAVGVRTTMSGPMDNDAYHAVIRPPKPDAQPSMSTSARDALEHDLHCQCGCTLDVFTCRTTDFTCSVSPAMHHDVMQLVAGGYSKPEIMGAFRAAYGDRVLMAPVVEGFNWAAYVTPFLALGAGATLVAFLIRRWTEVARLANSAAPATPLPPADVSATPSELARLDAAIRDDTR